MIKPEMVPEGVWHAAMSTYHKTIKKRPGSAWQEAIAAAFNAWPGMRVDDTFRWLSEAAIILPMEDKNAEG